MTIKEAVKILAILKAAYPTQYPYNMSADDARLTAIVWAKQFMDIPGDIVAIAIEKIIGKDEKPCTPARVKKEIGSLYWEAKEELEKPERYAKLGLDCFVDETTIAKLKYIKEATEDYKYSKAIDTPLYQIIGQEKKLLGGSVNDR